jgi:hypothetical protein
VTTTADLWLRQVFAFYRDTLILYEIQVLMVGNSCRYPYIASLHDQSWRHRVAGHEPCMRYMWHSFESIVRTAARTWQMWCVLNGRISSSRMGGCGTGARAILWKRFRSTEPNLQQQCLNRPMACLLLKRNLRCGNSPVVSCARVLYSFLRPICVLSWLRECIENSHQL